ncbi:Xylem bark cysteine peptidase 3 isoform 1 [Tripterygium wilfordii]|uniref:Xylem bark cysteine peptidase 3 isoform 1 n=1 Tax=Tripterygium wilfordii TaxID=458696 RepID=A0A7J7C3P9_TRIWF|nr:low-temperature-induced cysteine proteinase-like [Tripterygium wilfordii]KAF5728728.1 Xylem bark cysteine peptidase 3 isoform 1 [Tripterygium wilfordii]
MDSQKCSLAIFLLLSALLASLTFGLSSEYSIVGNDFDNFVSEGRVIELFQQWKEMHRKVYKYTEEAEKRFQAFKRNLRYVVEKNSKVLRGGHVVGLNKFADLSNEEFREVYLAKVKKPINRMSVQRKVHSCEAPSSLDWRKRGVVTAVKDQGSCGSCWAFSSTGAMEGINAIVTRDLISLSEQELVDCDTTNDGCEGGYMDYAFEWVINNGGIDTESGYPYTGVDGSCNTTEEETKVVSIDGYEDVGESDSALLCATVQQPISVGMDGSAIDFQLYTGGIYDGDCSDNPDDIDHAVLIVGYGSENGEDYWIIKNSWGTSWGMDGYFYLKRNTDLPYGVCAINAMASYPTKEYSAPSPTSPTGPPPPPPTPSPSPPPPPPSPSPSECGDFSYCPADETCCCILELFDYCFAYGCCDYVNAVCCTGTDYCCPSDYPICDIEEGLCLQNTGDYVGVATKKRKMAKHKFPWTKMEEAQKSYQAVLQWKRNPLALAALR